MSLSALFGLFLQNRAETFHVQAILVIFFIGAALAWPLAIYIGRFCAIGRRRETAFAAFFVSLCVLTMAVTASVFAMEYRVFFSRWHSPFGTFFWFLQFSFTFASACYQFVVMGVRLYMPLGFAILAATSLCLAVYGNDERR